MKQFKLINNKTKEETICSLVTIDGYDYYVSDNDYARFDSFITDGKEVEQVIYRDMVTMEYSIKPNGRTPMCQHRPIVEWETILTTNNPNIDIPKILYKNNMEELKSKWCDTKEEDKNNVLEKGIIIGYSKAKEIYQFTEEDVLNFTEYYKNNAWLMKNTNKEILDIWKEQQLTTIYYE